MTDKREYVCIHCMHPCSELYYKFSSEVIRLKECENCGEIVDKYIEYDSVLIVIDLIIHYSMAYKHFLYNVEKGNFLRLAIIFCFCEAYDKWITERASLLDAKKVYDLEWIFYKSLIQSSTEFVVFTFITWLVDRISSKPRSVRFIAESTIIGYYGNVAVVLSIIFRLSNEFSYRFGTQVFLLISHIQVQRALFPKFGFVTNILIVLVAMGISSYTGDLVKIFFKSIDS
ncbi:unnamed protein product [Auanema sp. JU1783]|nr:unnamed protein product [Auanema sp. JU1783]